MPADAGRVFFDSNTLLYLISKDFEKAHLIRTRLSDRGTISVQVLNEFTNVARRKHRLTIDQIQPVLSDLRQVLDVVPLTIEVHDAGLRLIRRYGLSTYDAMIVAAAMGAGCDTVLSEDMQHGMLIDGKLRIVDPFASAAG